MREADPRCRDLWRVLVAATVVGAVWCAFGMTTLPIGPVDRLYGQFRSEVSEAAAGAPEAKHLMTLIQREVVDAVRIGVLFTGVPLLVANLGWGYLAYRLLRDRGDIT